MMRAELIALTVAMAQSPHSLTGNVALVGDYRFRGLSQTYTQPAVQGGVDFTHVSGAYLGTWGSNVSGNQFLNRGSLELGREGRDGSRAAVLLVSRRALQHRP